MPSSGHQARLSRPKLTINTQPPPRPVAHDACAQSAPAGTRQEKGIAPMYQAGDRHCAKLAEMMDSPTWRSQNLVPYMGLQQVAQPSSSTIDQDAEAMQFQKEYAASLLRTAGLSTQNSHNGRPTSDVVHLGRSGHEIEILGIQSFQETSETSSNTFIISAAVSQGVQNSHETWRDEGDGDNSDDHQDNLHSPLASEHSSRELRRMRQGLEQQLENNAMKVMELDDAVQSIKDSLRPPHHQRRVTSDEQQRFRGLIDRLHQRPGRQDEDPKPSQVASFVDPAIISFLPKKTDPGTPTKRRNRNRSDSGYISSSGHSRPSTGVQSRTGRETSGSADSGAIRIEHQNIVSHDSAFEESPPKNSLLNPTAKEFSVSNFSESAPVKKSISIRSPASRRVFVPSQQSQRPLGTLPASQTYPTMQTSQGPWYPLQPDISNPSMALASLQHGVLSGILPSWVEIPGTGIPPMAPMVMPPFSGHVSGLGHPTGFGLPGLTTSPGLGHVSASGAFHQQLPGLGPCCNPSHQTMTTFSPPALHGIIPQPLAPQTSGPSVPLAGLTNPAVPFIPKHVPKPKVPNTTGQQNWELMHELRRMNEPGYAQRCKDKQKKRYMKQLEKTGGQP